MSEITVSGLSIYPVKSLAGIELERAWVEPFGLQNDRRWMVVDEQGLFITQRQFPRMCLIQVALLAQGVKLKAPGMEAITIEYPSTIKPTTVTVWDDRCQALDSGDLAAEWLSNFLQVSCRLVYFPEDEVRRVDQTYAQPQDKTAFSDGFPLLLISQPSLDDLNGRLLQSVTMNRFRPNLVVTGCEPFAEDGWRHMRIGEVNFRIVKPCSRCSIPNVDPITGERGKEPAYTLSQYRRRGNQIFFGQNVIADNQGEIEIGMEVEILE